ncbi:hypothetical protein SAMN05660493_01515 [Epilithonimonas bovis DSM 19482]|uniref:Uncharacterized protein n=1 Tax=Epilithonimonas bovis DSM 19482 TaxID=1121284 RepID=A0A1U7PY99_9FLAO|nr:hypothetical protein [Epilithonimonas bovis]SIT96820.1 hypothetical protein SAMN05660493_01515 [Epilithonimonas bovis DSM 19482]
MEYNSLRKEIINFVDTELSNPEIYDMLSDDDGIVNILNGEVFIEFEVGESKFGFVSVKIDYSDFKGHEVELRLEKIGQPDDTNISESIFFHHVETEINKQVYFFLLNMIFIADRTKDLLLKNIKPG